MGNSPSYMKQLTNSLRFQLIPSMAPGWCWILFMIVIGSAGISFLAVPSIFAQQEGVLTEIRIEGAPQVERGQILSGLRSKVNELPDAKKITSDIKDIFSLGFFDDVKAEIEEIPGGGMVLIFSVKATPRIASFSYSGNHLIRKSKIDELVTLKSGMVYSKKLFYYTRLIIATSSSKR